MLALLTELKGKGCSQSSSVFVTSNGRNKQERIKKAHIHPYNVSILQRKNSIHKGLCCFGYVTLHVYNIAFGKHSPFPHTFPLYLASFYHLNHVLINIFIQRAQRVLCCFFSLFSFSCQHRLLVCDILVSFHLRFPPL